MTGPDAEAFLARLPRFGIGAAALGNLFTPVEDDTARSTIDTAWNLGVRHFDVAPHYGLGLAERRLGEALSARRRDEYVLSTKVGRRLVPSPETAHEMDGAGFAVPADSRRRWDVTEDGLRDSLDESLQRLGTDSVDIVYLHDPDEHVPDGSTVEHELDLTLPVLAALRDEGRIRAVGVGSKSTRALAHAASSGLIDVVMIAGRYTLLEQTAVDDVLPMCLRHSVAAVAVGVYNSGALALDEPRRDLPYEYGSMPDDVYVKITRLARICRDAGTTLTAAAVQFPLQHPAVVSVLAGARDPREVHEALERYASDVPASLWTDLEDSGLVRRTDDGS